MQETYRAAASIIVLRPSGPQDTSGSSRESFDVLLLHKPRKRDAWQLPQGGFEQGETAEECAVRELREEAGLSNVMVIGTSSQVYQYDFPASFRRFRPDHIKGQRIEFVFALADEEEKVHVDGKEVDRHQWAKPSQLQLFIKRKEYLDLVTDLVREAEDILRQRP